MVDHASWNLGDLGNIGNIGDVGSVEDEAHRLIDAAGDWWRTYQPASAPTHRTDTADGTVGDEAASPEASGSSRDTQHTSSSAPGDQTCTSCPWCRAKAAFGPIGADTFDSLADLLDAAAVSLRLLAQQRRAAAAESSTEPGSGEPERATTDEDATGEPAPDQHPR